MRVQDLRKIGKEKLEQNAIEDAIFKVDILLQFVLNMSKVQLITCSEKQVEEECEKQYWAYIEELIEGKPVQYITHQQSFMNLNFYVDENVLIPQPDTEILVEKTLKEIKEKKNSSQPIQILDLCTGSGAIAISLAYYLSDEQFTSKKEVRIWATDISEKALEIARKNAIANRIEKKIQFIQSDMFKDIPKLKFDMIVSNPPYIESKTISNLSKEVQNEPMLALDGGEDGLDFYKIIAKEGANYLAEQGKLLLEIGYEQKEKVITLLQQEKKFEKVECQKDLANRNRVIIAEKRKAE